MPSLDLRGAARQLADHSELGTYEGNSLTLRLAPGKENLNIDRARSRLEQAIGKALDRAIRLHIQTGKGQDTPASRRLAQEDERMKAARTAIEDDPNVRALQDTFDAVVEADTVRPVD